MKRTCSIIIVILILCICFTSCDASNDSQIHETQNNEAQTESKHEEQTTEKEEQTLAKIEVNNIFLSKSELTLGVGETASLIATISPSNAENTLTWSSSNDDVASVDDNGTISAKSAGDVVIKVEADNGILAVCTVTVKVKTGSVTGNVTYKYNNYVGNKPDTGTEVILVSTSITSLPDHIAAVVKMNSLPEGCFYTKVDGSGNYTINNVPVGEYYIVLLSANTNENRNSVSGYLSWGKVYGMFSKEGQESALVMARIYKTRTSKITVYEDQTTTYSYDFGITYS